MSHPPCPGWRSNRARPDLLRESRWTLVLRAIAAAHRRHPFAAVVVWTPIASLSAFVAWFLTPPVLPPRLERAIVTDVTQLYPIEVDAIVQPRSAEEVQDVLRAHDGPVCIGGGRYSMGGQTATEGCLQIDMRRMDDVLELDVENRTVRVEAGITWRALQHAIDPHDLAIRIMQSYSSFTVGGALGVNAHGRYVGEGPVIRSVRSIRLVLADGTLVYASPEENADLFYGAIGGYGGIGVIVEATLGLARNAHIERHAVAMPVEEYAAFFAREVRESETAVFHNGDLYPPELTHVQAVTWSETDAPLTETERFIPRAPLGVTGQIFLWADTDTRLGKLFREWVYDPVRYSLSEPVVLRNHEASYDVSELEPPSRRSSTYVLQEYFVPVGRFDDFVPRLRAVLEEHEVNALNVSIRHARPDPGSLLAWAPEEMFAFVLYYQQGTDRESRDAVAEWTRALIDEVLDVGGTYYLPYQPVATDAQMRRAYPRLPEWAALKARVDPGYRFRNRLWDRYLPPRDDAFLARQAMHAEPAALRAEGQTFLTLPEWYIVWSAEEYADALAHGPPSAFPYFESNAQLWRAYRTVYHRTEGYPPNAEYHVMNCVIGASFTSENVVKAFYETTIGRIAEAFADRTEAGGVDTPEDRFAADVAERYDRFIRSRPWYEFPYREALDELWSLEGDTSSWIRSAERRMFLTAEWGVKSVYAGLIGGGSQSAYGPEETTTTAWIVRGEETELPRGVTSVERFGREEIVELPRYEAFRFAAADLVERGARFREIAGNTAIAIEVRGPRGMEVGQGAEVLVRWEVLTSPDEERALIVVPVRSLHRVLGGLPSGARIDHVFDY
jgi:FAD/FMN-containing dehydrogenase